MKKVLISISIISIFIFSCTDITELNEDTKNPIEVPSGALFANATVELFDFMASTNVNINNMRMWAQHWTATTYPDEANYELTERDVNGNTWDILYGEVIRDIREARQIMQANPDFTDEMKKNQDAIFTVVEVFAYHLLVDIFGDVPYSAAYGDDVTPAYDDAQTVYYDIIDRLNNAISNMDGISGLGQDDVIYNGDVSAWKKAANTLKFRMAIRIADFDMTKAQGLAEDAVNSGIFTSSTDDLKINYRPATPHTNPLWVDLVQSGRTDFVAANTLVDYLNALDDPRRDDYFTPPYDSVGNPIGGVVGASNSYPSFSHLPDRLKDPTYPHTILSYKETLFLLADAAERGFSVGGDAEDFYNQGITLSILEWDGTQAEADAYIAQSEVAYSSADWRDKLGLQKWIAMYNRPFEAWTTWRFYDAPMLNEAAEVGLLPPTRYIYPVTEYSLNGASVTDAAANYNDDDGYSQIFWDVN